MIPGYTVQQMRKLRRRYVRLILQQLYENKRLALKTYVLRMQELGLFSKKTALVDAQAFVVNYVAKIKGYSHWGEMFAKENDNWRNWR